MMITNPLEQGFEIIFEPPPEGASSYQIRYRQRHAQAWITHRLTDTTVRIFGLASGDLYEIEIRAIVPDGYSMWSDPVRITPT